jgi:hypothetical protein
MRVEGRIYSSTLWFLHDNYESPRRLLILRTCKLVADLQDGP